MLFKHMKYGPIRAFRNKDIDKPPLLPIEPILPNRFKN
jgi:hypothetical protein